MLLYLPEYTSVLRGDSWMRYNRYLSSPIRAKKRKLKRKRLLLALILFTLLITSVYAVFDNEILDRLKGGFLIAFENDRDGEKRQDTKDDTYETTGNGDDAAMSQSNSAMKLEARITRKAEGDLQEKGFTIEPKPMDTSVIKRELENYIEGFEGQYGIHFYSLYDRSEFGINDTDEYDAASTAKLPLILLIYKKVEKGYINLDDILTYTKEDYSEGTGVIRYVDFGKRYTVRELAKLSIEESDNVATNMLKRLIGGEKVYREFMKQSGGIVVDYDRNISCPKDMSLYLKMVYDFYKENEELGGELMEYLQNTAFTDRLNKLLPPNVKVAHKVGTQVRAVHDVGIIYAEKPYVLSVMSKDVDEAEAPDVIANISEKIYKFVAGN